MLVESRVKDLFYPGFCPGLVDQNGVRFIPLYAVTDANNKKWLARYDTPDAKPVRLIILTSRDVSWVDDIREIVEIIGTQFAKQIFCERVPTFGFHP